MTVKEYCNKTQRSEITLMLIEELKQFSTTDDYILGVLANSKNEEDRRTILNYIQHGTDVTYESIILLSLELGQNREKSI